MAFVECGGVCNEGRVDLPICFCAPALKISGNQGIAVAGGYFPGVGGSEATKNVVYLQSASIFRLLQKISFFP